MIYDMPMAKEILRTMGRRVRVLREEKGLNQIELAAHVTRRGADCSNSMISSIETGRANPSLEVFVAIADVLDVTLDYLATRTDNIESPNADPQDIAPVGISPEAQEVADLVDGLPPWRRRELLGLLHSIVDVSPQLRNEAHEVAQDIRLSLAAAGLVLGDDVMAAIRGALLRFVAGPGAAPADEVAPPARNGGGESAASRSPRKALA